MRFRIDLLNMLDLGFCAPDQEMVIFLLCTSVLMVVCSSILQPNKCQTKQTYHMHTDMGSELLHIVSLNILNLSMALLPAMAMLYQLTDNILIILVKKIYGK